MIHDDPHKFKIALISAWNDSGGAFTHRLFDGHPDIFSTPFELQLGTGQVKDLLSCHFHEKYRWPRFLKPLQDMRYDEIFASFIDDELKSSITDHKNSKFRDFHLGFTIDDLMECFKKRWTQAHKNRAGAIQSYILAIFDAWAQRKASGSEKLFLGHCPVVNLDADLILSDFQNAKIIHVVRDPVSGFSDMQKRHPELSPKSYAWKWCIVNSMACAFAAKYPDKFYIVGISDILLRKERSLKMLCKFLDIEWNDSLMTPTWNGSPLKKLYPFGGLSTASIHHERSCHQTVLPSDVQLLETETAGVRSLLTEAAYVTPTPTLRINNEDTLKYDA